MKNLSESDHNSDRTEAPTDQAEAPRCAYCGRETDGGDYCDSGCEMAAESER